jgi:hypothetical protein
MPEGRPGSSTASTTWNRQDAAAIAASFAGRRLRRSPHLVFVELLFADESPKSTLLRLGELAAAAPHQQLQQRREREIHERKEHPQMLPEPAAADIENRNLDLAPFRAGGGLRLGSLVA